VYGNYDADTFGLQFVQHLPEFWGKRINAKGWFIQHHQWGMDKGS
jgi:hypothetical protein